MFAAIAAAMSCRAPQSRPQPSITLTRVPEAGAGGPSRTAPIEGRVAGAEPGDRVVLFARSGVWWVQPFSEQPFSDIGADGAWRNISHIGTEYAAMLVAATYKPPGTLPALPQVGSGIRAIAVMRGTGDFVPGTRSVTFSGYDWQVRDQPSDRGGLNDYDPRNAWVDDDGHLHLQLVQRDGRWTSAEVALTRSLGYGTYSFIVRDVAHLEPAAVLGLLTWDEDAADQNHREFDVELSRWGDPAIANAQYVVQPYYVAANVHRFAAPAGRLTHSVRWEPGRAEFSTARGTGAGRVAQHVFTSSVPVPGNERVRMNLYFFRFSPSQLQKTVEVVVEKFQYLP